MPELYCLNKSYRWVPVDLNSTKYDKIYSQILNILNGYQGKGSIMDNSQPTTIRSGTIKTKFIKVISHRCCTVAYCIQSDTETNGVRYLVYGTQYNEDSTYGIGVTLNSPIITETAEKLCPRGNIAKYI